MLRASLATACALMAFALSAQVRPRIGEAVSGNALHAADGRMVSFDSYPEAKGFIVVFTCDHCPFAKLYSERLNELHRRFLPLGVPLLAINAMDTLVYEEENFAAMRQCAEQRGFEFPYLQDAEQRTVLEYGAEHTPEAFVVWRDGRGWTIRYAGAIDDNGMEPEKAEPFVANAVVDLLAGRALAKPETESFGCRIFVRNAGP